MSINKKRNLFKCAALALCLLAAFALIIAGCDNGSSGDAVEAAKSTRLAKVSLTVGGDAQGMAQKSISVGGLDWSSLTYKYKAVPQWTANNIQGAVTTWTNLPGNNPGTYSDGMSLGYFTPGQWVFHIQILNGSTPIYQGNSAVYSISSSGVAITVPVSKIVTEAQDGSVQITVTAATQENDSLTISYTGTASGSTTADASRSGGITTFSKTISSLGAGTYEFTLTHSNGTTGAVAGVELTEGQAATITGYLDNGTWQVGLVTINIYSVAVDANITNGSVTADVAGAAPGDKVVLYVEPDDGYILSTISVNSGAVSTTDISDANGVAYTFTMPDADVTVTGTFASAPTYAITTGSAEHGSVTADVAGAAPGDKVVLYVEPDDGYLLTSITVAGTSGNVETTAIKAGTYKFTMPNTDVTVAATFSDLYTSTPFDRSSVAIGDVVLEDGRTVTVANYADYKAAYDLADGAPVGVVAYTGTTGTAGITGKVYMLGLSRRSLLKWAPSGTTGYTTKFSTSLTAGEGNWGVITSADSTGSADAATNYPAFNYANTYNAGGNYTSGWFLPSFQELRLISSGNATGSGTTRRNTLNNSLNAIISAGVTANALPTSGHVWSSSQSSSDNNYAHTVYFYDGSTNVKTKDYVSEQYLGSVNVLVVRALD